MDLAEDEFRRAAAALEAQRHAFGAFVGVLAADAAGVRSASPDLDELDVTIAAGEELLQRDNADAQELLRSVLARLSEARGPRATALRKLCGDVARAAVNAQAAADEALKGLQANQESVARELALIAEEMAGSETPNAHMGGLIDRRA